MPGAREAKVEAITTKVAVNIRMISEGRGVTLPDLWDRLGMSKQSFYKRMNGGTRWKASELSAVADHLNVRVDTLLDDPSDLVARMSRWMSGRPGQPTLFDIDLVAEHLADEVFAAA